jgi:hypothetical protein
MKLSMVTLLAVGIIISGCVTQRERSMGLSEALLHTEIQESLEAMRAKDVQRVFRNIAPEWQGILTMEIDGDRQTRVYTRDSYEESLRQAFSHGEYLSLTATNILIHISEDAQLASISCEVHQKYGVGDLVIIAHGSQTNTIQLIDGEPVEMKMEAFARYQVVEQKNGH